MTRGDFVYLPNYLMTGHSPENREQLLGTLFSFGVHLLLYGIVVLPLPFFKHRAETLFERAVIVSLHTLNPIVRENPARPPAPIVRAPARPKKAAIPKKVKPPAPPPPPKAEPKPEPEPERPILKEPEVQQPAEIPAAPPAPEKPVEEAKPIEEPPKEVPPPPVVVAESIPTVAVTVPPVTATPVQQPQPPEARPTVAPAQQAAPIPTVTVVQAVPQESPAPRVEPVAPTPMPPPVTPSNGTAAPEAVPIAAPGPTSPPVLDVEITSPRDGARIDITDNAVIDVVGSVDDPAVESATVTLNGYPLTIDVSGGVFQSKVALSAGPNRLKVAMRNAGGLVGESREITVIGVVVPRYDIQVATTASKSCGPLKSDLRLGMHPLAQSYSPYKGSVDVPVVRGAEIAAGDSVHGSLLIKSTERGVYGMTVSRTTNEKDAPCAIQAIVTLYEHIPARKRTRTFEIHDLEGSRWTVTKIMMPEGVFWDDNDYFSGEVEDGRMITKFRQPDGIVWKELKE